MKKFETGKTYTTRSACDYDCVFSMAIAKRTAKTITTVEGRTMKIFVFNNVETVRQGQYSMAPIFRA